MNIIMADFFEEEDPSAYLNQTCILTYHIQIRIFDSVLTKKTIRYVSDLPLHD